jgi:hypothetical protein
MACADAYLVECEKLETLLDILLCREYKKHRCFGGPPASFVRILSWQGATDSDFAANMGFNWKLVWSVQPVGQKKVEGRNAIDALTQDFLPSYDKLLVALCHILESILPRAAPHQSSPTPHGFSSFGGQYTPTCMETEAVHDFFWGHSIPLNTPTPYCYKIYFNIIFPEVACWFFTLTYF